MLKTYTKRVAFMVSYQTLVPHGGIGQFTKSFVELMTMNNIKVDLILDKARLKRNSWKRLRRPAPRSTGWYPFPHYLQHPDGRMLLTAATLLKHHGYAEVAKNLEAMGAELINHPTETQVKE